MSLTTIAIAIALVFVVIALVLTRALTARPCQSAEKAAHDRMIAAYRQKTGW